MDRIPVDRVLARLDEHLNQNDFCASEKHLRYWLSEAQAISDDRGALTVQNELIGLYRKWSRRDEALRTAEEALALAKAMDMTDTVVGATTCLNAATACKAFGLPERAAELYSRAEEIYRRELPGDDPRQGGLYNNMGLALTDLGRFDEAERCYQRALAVMEKAPNGALEQAITCLNLAELQERRAGLEAAEQAIEGYLDEAERLLNTPTLPHNGYYAFVAEKCAPTFDYYGYFAVAQALTAEAQRIRKDWQI